MSEFKKAVPKGYTGCSDRFFRNVIKNGGPEAGALLDYVQRRRTLFLPDEFATLAGSIVGWEQARERMLLLLYGAGRYLRGQKREH